MNPPKNMSQLTVVICTHNPKEEFIQETLAALRAQTAPANTWDLLIIDNASNPPLSESVDLRWHPRARIVVESKLGVANARLRGLHEASQDDSAIILFVDDDNILAPDYISEGLTIGNTNNRLGCWGGQLLPRYLSPPPSWLANYQKYLAIFPLEKELITARPGSYDGVPPTAGAFVRRAVWERYLEIAHAHPLRELLGPKGRLRIGGEDMDLMLSAFDLGLELGRFPALKLEHIMPPERLTPRYMEGLLTSITLGTGILEFIRFQKQPSTDAQAFFARLRNRWRAFRLPKPIGGFYLAELRGRALAQGIISDWQAGKPTRALQP
jgi:glycosyltransferase involved in cell wall biosynthesis